MRLKDHAAATQAAAEVLTIAPTGWQEFHRGALFTCQAIPLAPKDDQLNEEARKKTVEAYATQAMQLLQQAVQRGYTDAAALKKEGVPPPK